jgi:hypothetical protein
MKMKYVIATPLLMGVAVYLIWAQTQKIAISGNKVPSQFAALNPAHGQPGHRCDIAVGAPLSSGNFRSISSPVPTVQLPASPVSGVAKPVLNPVHGQPGHRCDIAVGAPLTPANTAASSINSNTPAAGTQVFVPQPAGQTSASPTTPKPKINPAHGQDWHRCDLQVGAPLT